MVLSDLSIRKPVFAWMLMIGLIGFGLISFFRLGVSQLPDVDFPVITVSLSMEGASPESMEQDVVDVIEDQMMSIQGARLVKSSSSTGRATVTVEFDLSRNIDLAMQDVQAKVSQALKNLPPKLDPPAISKTNPDDLPIMFLTLQAEGYKRVEVMKYARDVLKNKFAGLNGVGDVTVGGYLAPNMRIWIKNDKLDKFYLAASDVVATLKNEQVDPPSGRVAQGDKEYNVRFYGEASTVKDFESIPLERRSGQTATWNPPKIGEVARIEEDTEDVITIARANQIPSVSFGIIKQRGSNAVEVARAVRAKIDDVQSSLPKGMKLSLVFDTTRFIEDAVKELTFTLFLSALLTSLVCWLFLGSWSSTFNVLLAIPTSIIGAFTVIYFMGFTLNTFTLLALSLSIGIVVDDAIMVLENITRHQEMGKGFVRAALDGAREITFAATAASISVVAIFLPVAFMKGIIGKFFFQFGVVLSAAVVISLIEALTLTPMRAAVITPNNEKKEGWLLKRVEHFYAVMADAYERSLRSALKAPGLVVIVCTLLMVASFASFKYVRKEFIPPEDQSRFLIRMQTPVGSSLDYSNSKMKEIEKIVAKRNDVEKFLSMTGYSGLGGDLNGGFAFLTLKDPGKRPFDPILKHRPTQFDIMNQLRTETSKIPDTKIVMQDLSMRGLTTGRGTPIEFTIQGPDWDKLGKYAQEMMAAMKESKMMIDMDTDFRDGIPELQIYPDRTKTTARGVSVSTVGDVINSMIGGERVGQYSTGGHRYDIRVKLDQVEEKNIHQELAELKVRNQINNLIPLSDLVKTEVKPISQSISRLNRERAVSIFSNVTPGTSQEAALNKIKEIGEKILPQGYHVEISGSSQTFKESFQSLILALFLGLFIAYMILATQFNSFIDPVSVLVALPFSLTGAFLSLLITNQSLNIYSMIGLILLMGIAKKNSILLVEFTNEVRTHDKLAVKEALLKACPIRLRPIFMTSVATIAGAIPPALAIGPGAESRVPMAITIIGGVLISTLFTLYLVPAVYELLSKFEDREGLLDKEERLSHKTSKAH